MTIVTYRQRRRKRSKAAAQAVDIKAPRIVTHGPRKGTVARPLPPDAEADARVAAFFERMRLKLPDDG